MKKAKQHWLNISIVIILLIIGMFVISYFRNKNNCSSIALIYINGEITSSPQYNDDGSVYGGDTVAIDVVAQIRKAEKDKKVKAVVFLIDSGGGMIQSGEEIRKAMKEIKKPTASLIRSQGNSSAYWIASATGRIFASETSDIGAIGVTMSFVDNAKQNNSNGLTFNKLSSGKYKDMGNPDKPLTEDERKLLIEQVNESAETFIKGVAENRKLPIEKVRELADGSSFTGKSALNYGLIDEIGSFTEIDSYLSKILKTNVEMCIPVKEIEKNNNYERSSAFCSEREAGYNWAKESEIADSNDCKGNSESFIAGCVSYVRENN